MSTEQLLELRSKIKANKPLFLRQEGHKRVKLGKKWRQPRGIQSKLRRKFKSRRMHPSPGYSSPAQVRFLNRDGLSRKMVMNAQELTNIDPKTEIAIIGGTVGDKTRLEIARKALELKVKIENMKDPASFVQGVETALKKKKEQKETVKKKREAQEKKAEEKKQEKKHPEEKKEEEKTEDHEEKKKAEKHEQRKVLEKRQ